MLTIVSNNSVFPHYFLAALMTNWAQIIKGVFVLSVCYDTPSENTGLWQSPKVYPAFKLSPFIKIEWGQSNTTKCKCRNIYLWMISKLKEKISTCPHYSLPSEVLGRSFNYFEQLPIVSSVFNGVKCRSESIPSSE